MTLNLTHVLECTRCGGFTKVSGIEVVSITCHECVNEMMREFDAPLLRKKKQVLAQGYPRGWRFMKEFVHTDGTVYFKGVEQPELKGTKEVTTIAAKPKKTKAQKKQEKENALIQLAKLKSALKKTIKKGEAKKLQTQIKKLEKQIK
jgi:hypothetical protein